MKKHFFTTELGDHEGLEFITVKSPALKRRGDICVYRPKQAIGLKSVKTVLLLHGVYGSHWAWSMKAKVHESLEEMLSKKELGPMILIMPSDGLFADGSAYVEHSDANYEKWITEDVIAASIENISECSEQSDFHIAGLSMGGYGAMRIGAKYSHKFNSFSGLSSITQFSQMNEFVEDFDQLEKSARNTESVLEAISQNSGSGLRFRFDCGKDDLLIEHNRSLHEQLEKLEIKHHYEEFEGGHEWTYWQKHILKTLRFFDQT